MRRTRCSVRQRRRDTAVWRHLTGLVVIVIVSIVITKCIARATPPRRYAPRGALCRLHLAHLCFRAEFGLLTELLVHWQLTAHQECSAICDKKQREAVPSRCKHSLP
jgi:hypothetical protein